MVVELKNKFKSLHNLLNIELIFLWVLLGKNEFVRWPRPQNLPRF
nr:MAG TPA: hypothetical protein [Caudoviricetes sp.]